VGEGWRRFWENEGNEGGGRRGEERRGEERRGEEKRRDFHFFKLFFGTKGNNFPALFES